MKREEREELKLQLDVLAGVTAELDEDSLHVLKVVCNIFEKIRPYSNNVSEVDKDLLDGISLSEHIINNPDSFDDEYEKLCAIVDRVQRKLEAHMHAMEVSDMESADVSPESAPRVEAIAEVDTTTNNNVVETAGGATERPMSVEDSNEFETQLEVLESLVKEIKTLDRHVIKVIGDIFLKIEMIETLSASYKDIASEGIKISGNILSEEIPFNDGKQELYRRVCVLRGKTPGIVVAPERKVEKPRPAETASELDGFDAIFSAFLQQHATSLEELEEHIMALEKGSTEAHGEIKRYLHTLKGECGVLGLTKLQTFIHNLESCIMDLNFLLADNDRISALLSIKDFINEHMQELAQDGNSPMDEISASELLEALEFKPENILPIPSGKAVTRPVAPPPPPQTTVPVPTATQVKAVSVSLDTENPELMDFITETNEYLSEAEIAMMNLEREPDNMDYLNEVFRIFHNVKGIAGFLNLKDVQELSHNAESLLDLARDGLIPFTGEYSTAAFESLDMLKEMVEGINNALSGEPYYIPDGYSDLVSDLKILCSRRSEEGAAPRKTKTSSSMSVEDLLKEAGFVEEEEEDDEKTDAVAIAASAASKRMMGVDRKSKMEGVVKITTARLDTLIDAVGELVIANAMVVQEPEIRETKNPRLNRNLSLLGKITRELQELAMSMRMVSLHSTFHKMARVARDLSMKSGVPVDFIIAGEDTELDRNVVEEIGSPLVHMVRNAVDHGIESTEDRLKAGKSEKGKVFLRAYHEGGNVVIEIEDDGKGLDKEAILEKAIKQNLITGDGSDMSDKEIFALIFHAGFSTAKKVTDVSGRGVGMDVVKKSIEKLRGRVDIDSRLGKGSKFTIRLPLTLAIIDGMVVTVGDKRYIIPTITINESIRPVNGQVKTAIGKGEMLNLRNELLPLFRLYNLFEHNGAKTDPEEALLVIISGDGKKCALMVDELVGQQQVVIKSLGHTFDNVRGISGGAIMGDGKVALILDTSGLVRLAHSI